MPSKFRWKIWPRSRDKKTSDVHGHEHSDAEPSTIAPAPVPPACQDRQRRGEPKLPLSSPEATALSTTRDLWHEALNRLDTHTRQKLQIEFSEPRPLRQQMPLRQQIDELVNTAKTKQEECEEKFWKFTVGDREIIPRDYAANIVSCLTQIGDIAVEFAPPQISVPWFAIRGIMQIPVNESAQMCALLASTEKVVRIVNRGQVYELVYKPENTPELALKNLQDALVVLYSATLELLAHSSELFSKDVAAQTMHAILHPTKTEGLVSQLDDLETKLGNEVQVCQSGWNDVANKRLTDLLHRLEVPLTRVDERVCALVERVAKAERHQLLTWISPILYRSHHNTVKDSRTSGTCEWLLRHNSFRDWERSSSSMILWLQGSPGTGKTFLTSRIIDHVEDVLTRMPNHEGFAYFYCNRNEEVRRKPHPILQSYVRQLSTFERDPNHMQARLRKLCNEMALKGSDLSFDTCKQLLLESVNLYPKTTIVLDALDECEPNLREQLVNTILELLSQSKRLLKVFISSRPDGDIRPLFTSRPNIEIQATNNQSDIEKFVNKEIDKPRKWGPIPSLLRKDIVSTLLERSQGMFQWANLQIKQVLELPTEEDIRARLGKLPTGLKDAYDEIYGEIAKYEHTKTRIDRACLWVMSACAPLSSEELLSAIRVNSNQDTINLAKEITESQLLAFSNNLLVLDSEAKVWRFSHLSVIEYLEEKNHWDLRQAHSNAAKVCLQLLIETYKNPTNKSKVQSSVGKNDSEPRDIFDLAHPFQEYLRHHWVIHVRTYEELSKGQEVDPMLARLLQRFLGSPRESSMQYRGWYRQIASDRYIHRPDSSFVREIPQEEFSPEEVTICAMCRFPFHILLRDWWDNAEITLSQTNCQGEGLLVLAATAGCKLICEVLLKRGIQVNALSSRGKYGSALAAAVHHKRTEIVKMLIEKGADVNLLLSSGDYGSALAAAAYWERTEIVKMLIEKGADVNLLLSSGNYGSALAAAAYGGETEIVKMLIEKGADVNLLLSSGDYGSALAAAAYWERTEIVKMLIEKGADVNLLLSSGNYGSALAAAAYGGETEIVKMLIEKGADVNLLLSSGNYGSALAAAASGRETEIVKMLIENGADVNLLLSSGDYGSALAAAVYEGKPEIVKMLIKKGADVNLLLSSGNYGSALAAAAYGGETEIVKMLIEKGADVNLLLSSGGVGNALAAAAYRGWKSCAQSLLDAGAKVNTKLDIGPYRTALQASLADISAEDQAQMAGWDQRDENTRKQEKAEVAELLQCHGATNED